MWKLIILVALLANINSILTESMSSDEGVYYENDSSTSASDTSSSSSSSSSESASSSSSSYSDASYTDNQCVDENEGPEPTNPDQPTTSPDQPTTTPDQPNTSGSTNAIEDFNKGIIKFTGDFFSKVVDANPNQSVVMSAYSASLLLYLLAYFSEGATKDELYTSLNIKSKEAIPVAVTAVLNSVAEQKNITMSLVAKMYGNSKHSAFSESLKTTSKEMLRAECENLDFSNAQQAADIINKWVADNTNNKITDLVPASALNADTAMVLTNACYFLAEWLTKFDPDATRPSDFYTTDGKTVKVDMMHQLKYFKYAELADLNAQALELPYVNQNLTYLVILPKEKDGAPALVKKLAEENALTSVSNKLEYERVSVSFPKFETKLKTDFDDILKKMKITSMFNPRTSGLVGMLADGSRVQVTDAFHQAYIKVTESGTEAAAATAIVGVGITSVPPPPKMFNANRSFIYYLQFRGIPIFCGLYAGN